jgi:D-aminoacyl-tRNA deacylase
MFKKYLIVASKKDLAGVNITTQLSQFRPNPMLKSMDTSGGSASFDFYLLDEYQVYTESIDLEKINKYDFIIFASKHQSEKKEKSLSVHAPGNWRNADFGGEKGKVCKSSALFQKFMFEKLMKNRERFHLTDYKVTMEVTHHGPLIDKPCVFIEIGSTDVEWNDRRAGFAIAKTIEETIEEFKKNEYHEIAIALGGLHYCPSFNKIQAKSNVAISHIIPNYVAPITEEMILEAVNKTVEEIDFALLDWKGLGQSDKRQEVINILEKNYISWKKTSDIKK